MVTTRFRSAVAQHSSPAPARALKRKRLVDDDQDEDQQDEREDKMCIHTEEDDAISIDFEEEDDADSDWEDTRKRKVKNGKKQVKTSRGSHTKSKRARTGKNLSLILTMPLDILYEILSHLPCKDLVSISFTSKPLHKTLTSRNATSVWKAVRNVTGVPDPMPEFSELRWAALLFGGTSCDGCGTHGVLKIDFVLRRRVCESCKKKNLVVLKKFRKNFEDYDESMLDLIPHTNVGGWAHGYSSNGKWWYESDIYDMAEKWGTLQNNIRMLRLPGARQKLEDFRKERVKLVTDIREHANVCAKWHHEYLRKRTQQSWDRSSARCNAIYAKFQELGYSEKDIDSVRWDNAIRQRTELTDRIWKRIRPGLEERITANRKDRVLKERKTIFSTLYQEYRKTTTTPCLWSYQPREEVIMEFPVFSVIFNAEHDVEVTSESFAESMTMLPALLDEWTENRKTVLRAQVASLDSPAQASSTTQPLPDVLDLATSVFVCPFHGGCSANRSPWGDSKLRHYSYYQHSDPRRERFPNPLFGWSEAGMHHTCSTRENWMTMEKCSALEVDERAVVAVEQLAALLGLREMATIQEMDVRNARFFCAGKGSLECGGVDESSAGSEDPKTSARTVHTWRSAVSHAMSNIHEGCPLFELLMDEQQAMVQEDPDPIREDYAWLCNHCVRHFNNWDLKLRVENHLKDDHGITDPQDPLDLFSVPWRRYKTIALPTLERFMV